MEYILNLFKKHTPEEQAAKELVEAEHQLLVYQSSREYATAMVEFYTNKIKRLNRYVNNAE